MKKVKEFSKFEYQSIRSELIERITIINSQSSTAIATILSACVAGISLCIINNDNIQPQRLIVLYLIRTIIFLIPILYLFPLSVKSGENLRQIASLSAYIRVFYDYPSIRSKKGKIMNWETSNNLFSDSNVVRENSNQGMIFYNHEYIILSLTSFVFYIIFSISSIYEIHNFGNTLLSVLSICLFLGAIIGIVAIVFIYKKSNIKNALMKYTPLYIDNYINRALELGLVDETEFDIMKEEINPYRNVDRK